MALSPRTAQFAKALAPVFKVDGFTKTGCSWHKRCAELIQVFNIQHSQWGNQFYLNIGIYLTELGKETKPAEYRCHIRCRVEELLPGVNLRDLATLLDFDASIDLSARYEQVGALITRELLPWFSSNSTKAGVAATLKRLDYKGFFLGKGVRECLTHPV